MIHPFVDGNGRVGRLLIALMLHEGNILSQPLLYLSLYFKQNRDEYYRLLDTTRVEGNWEAWIDFFLEGVEQTANGAVQTAKRLVALFENDSVRLKEAGGNVSTVLHVHDAFRKRPLLNVNGAARLTELSFPTVSKAIDALIKLGIVRELTGRKRNRVFAYHEYMSTLLEGTETG